MKERLVHFNINSYEAACEPFSDDNKSSLTYKEEDKINQRYTSVRMKHTYIFLTVKLLLVFQVCHISK